MLVRKTFLGVFATFEEWSDPNESNVVIPHNAVFFLISWNFENVLKYYKNVSISCYAQGKIC